MALELGPCQVEWNAVDVGKTQGGVTVSIKDDSVDLMSDQYGTGAEDTVITGTTVEVTLALAEVDADKLKSILQPQGGTTAAGVMVGRNKTSTALLALAQTLELTKYVGGVPSTNAADVITFPKAAPVGDVELSYDASNQRIANVTFKCFPGVVNSEDCLYYMGDVAATLA